MTEAYDKLKIAKTMLSDRERSLKAVELLKVEAEILDQTTEFHDKRILDLNNEIKTIQAKLREMEPQASENGVAI